MAVTAEFSDGTITPLYVIRPTIEYASGDLIDYEPDGIGNHMTRPVTTAAPANRLARNMIQPTAARY